MFFLLLPPQPLFPKDRKYPSLNERSKTLDAPRKQKEEEEEKEAATLVERKKHETSCVLHLLFNYCNHSCCIHCGVHHLLTIMNESMEENQNKQTQS